MLHLFEQPSRPVVADAQMALYERNRCAPMLDDDLDGLIVERIGFAARLRAAGLRAFVALARKAALEQALELSKNEEASYLPGWCGPVLED